MTASLHRLRLAGPAVAGILVAHWMAYFMTVDAHQRAHLLESTGHRYFPYLVALGVGLLVASLSGWISGWLQTGASPSNRFLKVAGRLSLLQVTGFIAMEVGERALFGHGASWGLLTEAPLLAGIALQFVAAALAALLLAAVAKVVDLVVRRRTSPRTRANPLVAFVSQTASPRVLLAAGAWSLRGPPLF